MVSVSYVVASATSVDIWNLIHASEIDSVQNSSLRDHVAFFLEGGNGAGLQECRSLQEDRQMGNSLLERTSKENLPERDVLCQAATLDPTC